MDAQTAMNLLRWYEELERRLIYFMQDIPPQGKNLDVWSPALATVIVESCNLIESVFYHITPNPANKKLTLSDYRKVYSHKHGLPERKVVIFQEPLAWYTPFEKWSGTTKFPNPDWWNIHNKSKHSRLDYFPEFTLRRAIEALSGALVVIATAPMVKSARELAHVMIKHDWLKIDLDMEDDLRYMNSFYDYYGKGGWLCPETALFAAIIRDDPLPPKISSDLQWSLFTHSVVCPIGKNKNCGFA